MSEIIEFIKNSPAIPLKRKSKLALRISELQRSLMESMLSNGQATSDSSSDASFRGLFRIRFVETVGEVSPDKWTTYSLTQKAVKYLATKKEEECKEKSVEAVSIETSWIRKPIMDGRYSVDAGGNVYNSSGKRLRPGRQSRGYLTVSLYDGSSPKKCKSYLVHRIVADAFLGPSKLPQVNHIDGNKENNCVSNLEFCSATYNQEHYLSELKE